ncbi:alpha-N-arabinofuranosidase [Geodermatophilus dictyosporus]|uniref:non-reducing end alpha-L-arabinofuranosidase n=1 Tax=Geodermatophilus dictyosporus TaxID=1523247 RepID=A0A1I5K310_9ACTN|nr:alpha-N-arabinofuranosidase [Geodermatophilus dictyosporus]SFO79123.1 alpha-N-arabinofuranosidase [Geodermatophilus dictyosporus]
MVRARLTIDPARPVGPVSRRLFGAFVEHMGRGVYGGIHEPGHPEADRDGFRRDVVDLVKEMGVTTVRYPGGNFVSGFRWEDSVGPRDQRPVRLNLAWHSTETNEVGLHEFASWLEQVGAELMLAVNLGTRGTLEALDLLEYANVPSGTTLAEQRIRNGRRQPFDVRMWCLGNEMDGPWQLGQMSAEDYGRLAARTAKAMRQVDPGLELVACGSSGAAMPTFGEWERTVLTHAYDDVDYLSCHAYYEEKDGDLGSFLASATDMDRFIETVVATADHVKAVRRSPRTINVSFDEWNVWYLSRVPAGLARRIDDWPLAPAISEDPYTVADGVVVGNLLMSLIRHADRVTSASIAQLVNVIAPIAAEPRGPAWRRSTFFPFAATSRLARGVALRVGVDCPGYDTAEHGEVPVVDAAATADDGVAALFLVNRSQTEEAEVTVDLAPLGVRTIEEVLTLSDPDPHAANTSDRQDRVRLRPNPRAALIGGRLSVSLPPVSWTAVSLH